MAARIAAECRTVVLEPRLANFFWYLAYEVPAHSDVLSIRLSGRVHKEVYFREMPSRQQFGLQFPALPWQPLWP